MRQERESPVGREKGPARKIPYGYRIQKNPGVRVSVFCGTRILVELCPGLFFLQSASFAKPCVFRCCFRFSAKLGFRNFRCDIFTVCAILFSLFLLHMKILTLLGSTVAFIESVFFWNLEVKIIQPSRKILNEFLNPLHCYVTH